MKEKNKYIIVGDYVKILINTKNKNAPKDKMYFLIDLEDLNNVIQHRWHLKVSRKNLYYIADAYGTRLHRFIMNCPKNKFVDHINFNTLDNRKQNLRICTSIENSQNVKKRKNNSTGFRNVYFNKDQNKYFVKLTVNKKLYFGGYFNNSEKGKSLAIKKSIELRRLFMPFSTI